MSTHVKAGRRGLAALAAALAGCLWAGGAAGQPAGATQPAPPDTADWGQAKAGLQLSLAAPADPPPGGELEFRLTLRNAGTAAVKLPESGRVVGWFVIGQETSDGQLAWYTQRYYPALGMRDWAAELAPGKSVAFDKLAISDGTAHAAKDARTLLVLYAAGQPSAAVPVAGTIGELVKPGETAVVFHLLLPQETPPPLALRSNRLSVTVRARPLKGMDPAERAKYVAGLLADFNKDEWAAQTSHATAVSLGKDVVPELVEAVKDRKRPPFARMWLATALADIRDDRSAAALAELLEDGQSGVRYVVGYHGPKQRSEKLDEAIVAKVDKARDTKLLAYAVLGFTVFRGAVPEKLLAMSLDSPDPRARSAAARALKELASDFNLRRLCDLLSDPDEKVRAQAARMLVQLDRRTPQVLRAMVEALDAPGEHARQRICQALVEMTGQNWPYDPKADEAARQETLRKWKEWAAKAPKRGDD